MAADINVTPMIDVMLVLLIIFMIVAPVIGEIQAVLPRAAHTLPSQEQPGEVRLGVDRTGKFFLDVTGSYGQYTGMRFITDGNLATRLSSLYAARADRIMFLKADADVPYARVQDAIQIARHAGVRVIGAIVEPRREANRLAIQE